MYGEKLPVGQLVPAGRFQVLYLTILVVRDRHVVLSITVNVRFFDVDSVRAHADQLITWGVSVTK